MAFVVDKTAVEAIFARPFPDGSFDASVRAYLRQLGTRRPLLLLAFAPKSAGTYFRQVAVEAVNGELVRLCHAQGGRDGTLYLPNVMARSLDDAAPASVAHIHMQAFPANRHLMDAFGLKPVIMIRNVADMLASFLDMLETDPAARAEGLNCQVPSDFCDMDRTRRLNFMVDMIAPWYASYFATWKTFVDEAPQSVCVLRYDDFRNSPAEAIHRALTHAGFVVSRTKMVRCVERIWRDRTSYRFNQGVSGRGAHYFGPGHFARLHDHFRYYPQLQAWSAELLG